MTSPAPISSELETALAAIEAAATDLRSGFSSYRCNNLYFAVDLLRMAQAQEDVRALEAQREAFLASLVPAEDPVADPATDPTGEA